MFKNLTYERGKQTTPKSLKKKVLDSVATGLAQPYVVRQINKGAKADRQRVQVQLAREAGPGFPDIETRMGQDIMVARGVRRELHEKAEKIRKKSKKK